MRWGRRESQYESVFPGLQGLLATKTSEKHSEDLLELPV